MPKSGQREDMMRAHTDQPAADRQVDRLFLGAVRSALHHLFDPSELRKNPLIPLLALEQEKQPPAALRTRLFAVIQALKPEAQTPPQAKSWRFYQILQQRFQEQCPQQEVANDLGLSIRHLRREEALAVRLLAEELWRTDNLAERWPRWLSTVEKISGWPEEMARLQAMRTREPVGLAELLDDLLHLIHPLAQRAAVQIKCTVAEPHWLVETERTTLRQLLLHLLSAAIQATPGGQLLVTIVLQPQTAQIDLRAMAAPETAPHLSAEVTEALAMAQQLSELCFGVLTITLPTAPAQPLEVQLTLPLFQRLPVLVIDDNQDTLQLLQRYLAHSQYHFIGVADPQEALAAAERYHPRLIVIDVMLPGVDGWELLGRLRQHPTTNTIPIIVCTILPQQPLALALGATAFLRKPITQQTFLATLQQYAQEIGR